MQLMAPLLLLLLLVSVSFMDDSLYTAVSAEELTVASDWLGGVESYDPRGFDSSAGQICDGTLGECNDDAEEFLMESEVRGRLLRRVRYYISYSALYADSVNCPPRSGRSYYTRDCFRAAGPVRPYSRSCTTITRCRRYTD